jgi:hypothetical protein
MSNAAGGIAGFLGQSPKFVCWQAVRAPTQQPFPGDVAAERFFAAGPAFASNAE